MALEIPKASAKMMSRPSMDEILDTLREMQEDQEVLRQAIHDALLSLGGPITETIIWQLGARGMLLNSHIDVQLFYEHLEQTVGVGADIVMSDVYENVMRMVENA